MAECFTLRNRNAADETRTLPGVTESPAEILLSRL